MPRPPTTIGIDCRFAATGTGLGRYTRELVTALLMRRDPWRYALFTAGNTAWIPPALLAPPAQIPAPFRHYSFDEQRRFPGILRRSGIDLLFVPHFNVPIRCPVPFVATIHDLILHRYPNRSSLPRRLGYRFVMRSAVRRARRLIAVSAFTKSELAHWYGESVAAKTSVIHEAVNATFCPAPDGMQATARGAHGLEKPFFLYVGNAKEHKNVQMLIDAFASAHMSDHELLLVTGGPEADRLRLSDRVRVLRNVADADLPVLYSLARCFVSASLYEGFGLPLIEAAACGCPAIVSDRAAFREIAPPGSMLVEPTIKAFATALLSPPPRPAPPATLRTWNHVAEETAGVFFDALAAH